MFRTLSALAILIIVSTAASFAADDAQAPAKLTAAQIADRNVAARGGLQGWRAVQTMTLSGKMEAGGNQRPTLPIPGAKDSHALPPPRPVEQVQLPFAMELERPRKTRIELQFNGQKAVQVFDGSNGWKFRPFLNRQEIESFTADELKASNLNDDLDGPLVDYAAKGTRLDLDGVEKVDGHFNYKLKLTKKSGQVTHLWINAESFLETKIEGQPRKLDGVEHPVEVYYRDFRTVSGLQIPFVLETRVLPVGTAARMRQSPYAPEKILIEKVQVNPKLEASHFTRPEVQTASNAKQGN